MLRGRSFHTVAGYCNSILALKNPAKERRHNARARQGPREMIPVHANFWHKSFQATPPWPPVPDGPPVGAPACSTTDLRIGKALTSKLDLTLNCTFEVLRMACDHHWDLTNIISESPVSNSMRLALRCRHLLPTDFWRILNTTEHFKSTPRSGSSQ